MIKWKLCEILKVIFISIAFSLCWVLLVVRSRLLEKYGAKKHVFYALFHKTSIIKFNYRDCEQANSGGGGSSEKISFFQQSYNDIICYCRRNWNSSCFFHSMSLFRTVFCIWKSCFAIFQDSLRSFFGFAIRNLVPVPASTFFANFFMFIQRAHWLRFA